MSENNTLDRYEVGYGKPPKSTQFKKGVSGNPKGRPKKPLDFDHELLREAKSLITINENGQRTRISKAQGIAKQLTNKALTGDISALKSFLVFTNRHPRKSHCWKHHNPVTSERTLRN